MLKKACAFISCALFLAACTTPLPKYKNPHPSAEDAHLTFESDFEYHTFFSVNIRNTADACGRFESAGYLLKVDSIFIFDKPNKEVSITVPSQQMVGIDANHSFSDPTYRSSCHPKPVFFFAEPRQTYIVRMNRVIESVKRNGDRNGFCYVTVEKLGDDKLRAKITSVTSSMCNQ